MFITKKDRLNIVSDDLIPFVVKFTQKENDDFFGRYPLPARSLFSCHAVGMAGILYVTVTGVRVGLYAHTPPHAFGINGNSIKRDLTGFEKSVRSK